MLIDLLGLVIVWLLCASLVAAVAIEDGLRQPWLAAAVLLAPLTILLTFGVLALLFVLAIPAEAVDAWLDHPRGGKS